MLEQRALLVRPRQPSGVRPILDADSGAPLGCVRRRDGVPRPWWRLLPGPVLAVHEHEDEPLLFTLRRRWGLRPRHDVRDADGYRVGSLDGPLVQDRYGRPVALRQPADGGAVFRSPDHRDLARLSAAADGLRLSFSDEVFLSPFARMLLLAAALSAARDD